MILRRWRANSRRIASADVWPIDESAGKIPPAGQDGLMANDLR